MTDEQIRALRRMFMWDSEEWATCTKALHASSPGDREMYRAQCARLLNSIGDLVVFVREATR